MDNNSGKGDTLLVALSELLIRLIQRKQWQSFSRFKMNIIPSWENLTVSYILDLVSLKILSWSANTLNVRSLSCESL